MKISIKILLDNNTIKKEILYTGYRQYHQIDTISFFVEKSRSKTYKKYSNARILEGEEIDMIQLTRDR